MASRPNITVNIFEKDLGFSRVLKEAQKLRRKPYVKVGVTQARGSKLHTVEDSKGKSTTKMTVADIAQAHEYGAVTHRGNVSWDIPERSFIRSTVQANQPTYDEHIKVLGDLLFDANSSMTTERALGLIGQQVSSDMKATIRAGLKPGLSPLTIAKKNRVHIAKAKATVRSLTAKADRQGYRAAQKASGAIGPIASADYNGKLSDKDKGRLNSAAGTVMTGGASTPLIDTGQLINALSYQVEMDGGKGGAE